MCACTELFFLVSIEEFAIRGEGVVEAAWGAVRVGEGVVEAAWGAVRVAEEGEARTGSREPVLAVAAMEEGILAKAVEGSFPKAIVNAKSE
jgi:hypothetical protein